MGVILKERDISKMGVLLLLVVLLLLAVVRTASRMADAKTMLNRQLAGKTDDFYLATGKVCCDCYVKVHDADGVISWCWC